jgi:hypothetical protein
MFKNSGSGIYIPYIPSGQGCGTRKFEDCSGSDILSDYGSGSSSGSGSYTCIYVYVYVFVNVYIYIYS